MTQPEPSAEEKLRDLRERTAANSNAGTVSAIATGGHVASAGIVAGGAYTAASTGGLTALKCFAGRIAAPLAGAMAGAWVAEKVHADEGAFWVAQQFGAKRLAGPGKNAARLKHQIAHSNAFAGLLAGIVAGIVVGAIVAVSAAAIIGTAGMAAPLVGAAVAFGAGAVGGFVTSAIAGAGAKTATLSGPISSGSPNVLFEGQPAARVTDTAACTKHPGSPPSQIIEGSETILINGLPMARIGHKLSCDAVIQEGCETVLGDDTTGLYGTPDAEFSVAEQLLLSAAEVIGMRSAVRQGGLVEGRLRNLVGEPVDIVTGDFADYRTDFDYPGLIRLRLARAYPGKMQVEGLLGPRWICSWSQRLTLDAEVGTVLLEDAEGQRLVFAIGDGPRIDARHLKAPYYHLTGTRDRMRLFDSRTQQFVLFAPVAEPTRLEMAGYEDRNGNRIEFQRDGRGRLIAIRHSDGTVFRVEINALGLMTGLRMDGEAEPLVRYSYDANGHLIDVIGAFTGEFHYRYTREGWLSGWRDSGLTQVSIAYDPAGRVVGTETGDGMFNDRFLYYPEERRSRYIDATGAVYSFTYNQDGMVTEKVDPLGAVTISEWDSLERLQRRIDPAGRETRYAYDGDGRLIGETDWAGRSASWSYDRWGALVASTAVEGTATWTRDARGNIIAWTSSRGNSGTAEYDDRGALIRENIIGGGETRWEVDSAGRPVTQHEPSGRVTWLQWDRMGRIVSLRDSVGRTGDWSYERSPENPRGAMSHSRTPLGNLRFAYDNEGLLTERIRGDGQTTRFLHGAFDTLRQVVDPLGATTQFGYDLAGRLNTVTNAAGQQWTFRHDPAGRLLAQLDWAGRETRYDRDVLGRVAVKRMPDGAEQRFEWDARDRIVRVIAGDDAITYRYDEQDRLTGATSWLLAAGVPTQIADVELSYDDKGRIVSETQNGMVVSYRYDAAGRCIGRSSPSGETALAFDEAGLLTRYESNGHTLRFTHDAAGFETLRELAAIGTPTAFQLRQSYDPAGRITDQRAGAVEAFAAERPLPDALTRHYHWDQVGRLSRMVEGGAIGTRGETLYQYDQRDQAVSVERPGARETYRYDPLMNLAEGLAGDHRYWNDCVVEAGPNRFRYDSRGRMIERVLNQDGFRPRRWRYRWNGFDRLADVETPDGAHWRYTYDAFGRRVAKAMVNGGSGRRVDYVWQLGILAESWHRDGDDDTGSGAEPIMRGRIERWHYEADGIRPLAKEVVPVGDDGAPDVAAADLLPILADQVGSPQALFGAEGDCRWRAEQQLWGRTKTARALLSERGSDAGGEVDADRCALRFPGQWEDAETGLHYNLNRYYDPETGQYLSPDPIGLDGGLRTHGYVEDPLRWIDASGLAPCGTVEPVKPGQRGTYGELKAQKRAAGETEPMDMDHQPSFAAQVAAREAELGRKLTGPERATLKANTPAVASPRKIHQQTSPTYGGRNTPTRIAEDAADLKGAAARDQQIFDEALKNR